MRKLEWSLLFVMFLLCRVAGASVFNEDSVQQGIIDSSYEKTVLKSTFPDSADDAYSDLNSDSAVIDQMVNTSEKKLTSLQVEKDSITQVKDKQVLIRNDSSFVLQEKVKSPKIAGLLSTALPGAGQVYNRGWKSWWKIGIIYGGGYLLMRNIISYNKTQKFYYGALLIHDQQDLTPEEIEADLIDYVDHYENVGDYTDYSSEAFAKLTEREINLRYNDYRGTLQNMYVFSVVLYGLNILDAIVDAHLKSFDVSDDLSVRIKPIVWNTWGGHREIKAGVRVQFSLK